MKQLNLILVTERIFYTKSLIKDDVIRNFEVIGEATKKLSPEIRAKYSEVPWRRIAGLRDVLIHDYLRVDLEEVWGIIQDYLPELKVKIQIMIQDIE